MTNNGAEYVYKLTEGRRDLESEGEGVMTGVLANLRLVSL
jgi:hypothetical protein